MSTENELESLIEQGLVAEFAGKARNLPTAFIWPFVDKQFIKRRFDRVSRMIEECGLGKEDDPNLHQFVKKALAAGQFNLAIRWSLSLEDKVYCVQEAVRSNNAELALKHIVDMKLDPRQFDLVKLVRLLYSQENFTLARKYVVKYDDLIGPLFPLEDMIERMLNLQQWENAWTMITTNPSMKNIYNNMSFLQRIISSKDYLSAMKFATQFGMPGQATKQEPLTQAQGDIIRIMVKGMLQDGLLYQGMRIVTSYQLQEEFPPLDIIKKMIARKQFDQALRFMSLFKLESEFQQELPKIHEERLGNLIVFRNLVERRKRDMMKKRVLKRKVVQKNGEDNKVVVASLFFGIRNFVVNEKTGQRSLVMPSSSFDFTQLNTTVSKLLLEGVEEEDDDDIVLVPKKNPGRRSMPAFQNANESNHMYPPIPVNMNVNGHLLPGPVHFPHPLFMRPMNMPMPPPPPMLHPPFALLPPHMLSPPFPLPPPPPPLMPMPRPSQQQQQQVLYEPAHALPKKDKSKDENKGEKPKKKGLTPSQVF